MKKFTSLVIVFIFSVLVFSEDGKNFLKRNEILISLEKLIDAGIYYSDGGIEMVSGKKLATGEVEATLIVDLNVFEEGDSRMTRLSLKGKVNEYFFITEASDVETKIYLGSYPGNLENLTSHDEVLDILCLYLGIRI